MHIAGRILADDRKFKSFVDNVQNVVNLNVNLNFM